MKTNVFAPEGTHHPICAKAYDTAHKQGDSWRCDCELIRAACAWQRETDIHEVYRGACSCGGDDSHALNCTALLTATAIRAQRPT